MTEKLGLSGRIARLFLDSELTPLLGLTALLLGIFAFKIKQSPHIGEGPTEQSAAIERGELTRQVP